MNRRAFAVLAGLGLSVPLVARSSRADQAGAEEIVARVEAFYEKITTFKATFRQPYFHLPDKLRGSVTFAKPGRMSWRYAGTGNRVVSDGARIKVYEPESEQLFENELPQSLHSVALSFLISQGKLGQDFEFTKHDPGRMRAERMHVLVGKPVQASPVCELLAFYVDARSYEVCRAQIRDAAGNRHRFDFSPGKMNLPVPKGEFALSPPPGTRIIRVPATLSMDYR